MLVTSTNIINEHCDYNRAIIKPEFVGVGERRTPRASYVRRPTRTRIMRARALLTHWLAVLSSSPPTPPLLLWWKLKLVCVSDCTSSPRFRGDEPPRKAEQLVTPTTNCTYLLLSCLYRSKGAGLIRTEYGMLIALQRRAP